MNVKVTTWLLLLCSKSSVGEDEPQLKLLRGLAAEDMTGVMEKVDEEAEGNLRGLAARPWKPQDEKLCPDLVLSNHKATCKKHCESLEAGWLCDSYSLVGCAHKRDGNGECHLIATCKPNCPVIDFWFPED